MHRNTTVAIALVCLGAASCGGSSNSATSTASLPTSASVPTSSPLETPVVTTTGAATTTTTPTSAPTSASSGIAAPPSSVAPEGGAPRPPTSTNPNPAPGPPAVNPSPEPGVTTTAPAAASFDRQCTAAGTNGFDLQHAKVTPQASTYLFSAQYTGDAFQHDIVVSFDLDASRYIVSGELFEDGKGVGQLVDSTAPDSTFLDPPQTIAANDVELTVPNSLIGTITGSPFTVRVSLNVDGADIETCV